ncbi:MAG: cytochrome b/b6 domain-containing protein, partial [Plesiomonas sp.]
MAEANKHRLPADRWDAVVIATHWLVAGGFVCNRLLNEAGGVWHERIGLTVAGLVLLRLLWGLTLARGPARLSQFLPSWTRVRHHVAQIRSGELPNQLEH